MRIVNIPLWGERLVQEYLGYTNKHIGLMVSQVLNVSSNEPQWPSASVYDERHIGYLRKIADESHQNNTRFFAQLGLPGYSFYDSSSKNINELTTSEMEQIRDNFIHAAYLCKKVGLDGVE